MEHLRSKLRLQFWAASERKTIFMKTRASFYANHVAYELN